MPRANASPLPIARALRALAMVALLATPIAASAQVLYKWTDIEGRTQYGDKPPKNFTGPVTRIEIEPPAAARAPAGPKEDIEATITEEKTPDIAAKRRAVREALEAQLESARAKLERAKAALAEAVPEDSEGQVIQQRADQKNPRPGPNSTSTGGMLGTGGMHGSAAKQNCRTVKSADGKSSTVICPTLVPGEAYYERVGRLEDAVRKAEEEVAAAELAYRRGVD